MAGVAAAPPDRLSDLSDDLLIHVLSFLPSREAASTTSLSRRWRRLLWLETGVVNFDYRSYITTTGGVPRWWLVWVDACRAHKLYRSRGCGPRKLVLVMHGDDLPDDDEEDADAVEEDDAHAIEEEDQGDVSKMDEEYTGVDAVEVVAGVEELRVELVNCASPAHCRYTCPSPPFASLRVLEITGCLVEPDARGRLAFPYLEAMRLRRCRLEIATLQDMINAAPRLADLRLEAVCFEDDQYEYHLRCPTATVIVITDLHGFRSSLNFRGCSVKLDAPHVRRFRYANVGTFEDTYFSFEKKPPYLEQVHLAVHSCSARAAQMRMSLLISVRHVRTLKLTTYSMADLDDVMMYSSYTLQRLEIEDLCGWCIRDDSSTASALVKLLCQCPRIHELRIKFSWREYLEETTDPEDLNAAMSDFAPCRAIANSGNEEEDCCHGLDIHKLCCGCKVDCLQDSLRRVVVEFDMEELTCLQLRLVKFLAKNAMDLEEFVIDGRKGTTGDTSTAKSRDGENGGIEHRLHYQR
ncbi:hypothetical protein ACQ4PT_025075 [Festuca glaucescens]